MNKLVETTAKALAGIGALNWGIAKFFPQYDLLGFVPAGIINTGAVIAIAVSGGYMLFLLYKKRI